MRFIGFIIFLGCIFCMLLTPTAALATAQVAEALNYEGEKGVMFSLPAIPTGNPRIRAVSKEELDKKIADKEISSVVRSTACWRQYIGSWEIKDGRLYLIDVIGLFALTGEEPLFADWFSGSMRVPRGKQLRYVHMGFESVYEEDFIVHVVNGIVTGTEVIDNRPK